MTTLRILVHHGRHGDDYWLADTSIRAAQARETLFKLLDEQGCYTDDKGLKEARAGNELAIKTILDNQRYENWDYVDIEVPWNGCIPAQHDLLGFDTYQQAAHSLSIYPENGGANYGALGLTGEVGETVAKLGEMLEQSLVALKMAGSAGKVANQIKKIDRDDSGVITNQRRRAIAKELGDCLWYLAETATKIGFNLSLVASMNMANLFGRKDRGTIGGDGDNR